MAHEGSYQYDPSQTPEWNRGAYLVQGLGHCGECHSPRNMLGAVKHANELTGAFVEGYYAPDISGQGLKNASVADIVNVFFNGQMLKGSGKVQGPMAEVNYDSLHYMTLNDLQAMAIYLKTVKSNEPATTPTAPINADTGKTIYEEKCNVCHGTGAAGAPKLGVQADWAPRITQGMTVLYEHAINGFNSMPPKGTCMSCSDDEIKAAVDYLVNASQGGAGGVTKPTPPEIPKLTLADGKALYTKNCSVCHAQGLLGAPRVGDQNAWAPLIKENMDILFKHAIYGYNRMPPKGTCITCSDAEVEAAVKYMVQQTFPQSNFSLW
jgi:cytochrome c5